MPSSPGTGILEVGWFVMIPATVASWAARSALVHSASWPPWASSIGPEGTGERRPGRTCRDRHPGKKPSCRQGKHRRGLLRL